MQTLILLVAFRANMIFLQFSTDVFLSTMLAKEHKERNSVILDQVFLVLK